MNWAMREAPIPEPTPEGMPAASALAQVLVGLADHAGEGGLASFPSQELLAWYARISERQVRRCLNALEDLGIIRRGNQAIAAAHIPDPRHRPVVYDLNLAGPKRAPRGGTARPPSTPIRGDESSALDGLGGTPRPPRGDESSAEPYLNLKRDTATPFPPDPVSLDLGVDVPEVEPIRRRKPAIPLPDDWAPTELHWAKARELSLHVHDEAEAFRFHAQSNDRRQRDWDAAFSKWLLTSVKFSASNRGKVRETRVDRVSGIGIER